MPGRKVGRAERSSSRPSPTNTEEVFDLALRAGFTEDYEAVASALARLWRDQRLHKMIQLIQQLSGSALRETNAP
jgi:hypothetical protein